MSAPARAVGWLVLLAYLSLAVSPCTPARAARGPDARASAARTAQADAWCTGRPAKPPPELFARCPCGCARRSAALAGPSSLDHGLLRELPTLEPRHAEARSPAPLARVASWTREPGEPPPRSALA